MSPNRFIKLEPRQSAVTVGPHYLLTLQLTHSSKKRRTHAASSQSARGSPHIKLLLTITKTTIMNLFHPYALSAGVCSAFSGTWWLFPVTMSPLGRTDREAEKRSGSSVFCFFSRRSDQRPETRLHFDIFCHDS